MKKQVYQEPTIRVVRIQHQVHLLAGSNDITEVQSDGLDNEEDELRLGGEDSGWGR